MSHTHLQKLSWIPLALCGLAFLSFYSGGTVKSVVVPLWLVLLAAWLVFFLPATASNQPAAEPETGDAAEPPLLRQVQKDAGEEVAEVPLSTA